MRVLLFLVYVSAVLLALAYFLRDVLRDVAARRRKWTEYCGLTCEGGSERRKCKCLSPRACEWRTHIDFERNRVIATKRLLRRFRL